VKQLMSVVLAGLVGLMFWNAAATAAAGEKQKVVYHVNGDNPKQQTGALRISRTTSMRLARKTWICAW
jgi:hypothetical protein